MATITINRENAIAAFNNADPNNKKLLTDLLGLENVTGDITEIVTSYEAACKVLGLDPEKNRPWGMPVNPEQEWENKDREERTIIRALNGPDWKADYANPNQKKYYPRFYLDGAAGRFRFLGTHFVITVAAAGSGARRVFKSPELAKHYGTKFIELANYLLTH